MVWSFTYKWIDHLRINDNTIYAEVMLPILKSVLSVCYPAEGWLKDGWTFCRWYTVSLKHWRIKRTKVSVGRGRRKRRTSYPVGDASVKPHVTRLPSRRPTTMYTRRPITMYTRRPTAMYTRRPTAWVSGTHIIWVSGTLFTWYSGTLSAWIVEHCPLPKSCVSAENFRSPCVSSSIPVHIII